MNSLHLAYYQALGLQVWKKKQSGAKLSSAMEGKAPAIAQLAWRPLQEAVAQCTACALSQTRTQTVFGQGNASAALFIVGEAPGFHEDRQGLPFVGRAGQLLTAMLKSIDLNREEVYIANILKCRPPENRDPRPEETASCTPFLTQQIALVQPRLLLALGRVAARYLLQSTDSLEKLRGCVHTLPETGTPVIVTYHPAYLLRNPFDKKKAMADLLFVSHHLEENSHGRLSRTSS